MDRLRDTIECCLINIDQRNDPQNTITEYHHQLKGIRHALRAMGIKLVVNLSLYHHENGIPSTYEISLYEDKRAY